MKIKNIIFDVDNTIVKNEEEDKLEYKKVLKKYGYDESLYNDIYRSIGNYDCDFTRENIYYNLKDMTDFVNKELDTDFQVEFMEEIIEVIGSKFCREALVTKETLEYLINKGYNLYVFSNFYSRIQKERIRNLSLDKYFIRVFGSDEIGAKPFKEAFDNLLKEIGATKDECIMIGDDKRTDISGANRVGMKAILLDIDGTRDLKQAEDAKDYIVIKDLKELENIF